MKKAVLVVISLLILAGLVGSVRAQPVPVFFVVADYLPMTYWTSQPYNVSYSTACQAGCSQSYPTSEFYVFEWAFYWNYHPPAPSSSCAPANANFDYELLYVYVDIASQNLVGLAWRFHCSWGGVGIIGGTANKTYAPTSIITVTKPGVVSLNATLPVFTFLTNYNIPNNGYPNSTVRGPAGENVYVAAAGKFAYTLGSYNFTQVAAMPSIAFPVDPSSLLSPAIPFWEWAALWIALPVHALILALAVFVKTTGKGAPHG